MTKVEEVARAIANELARQNCVEGGGWMEADGTIAWLDQGHVDMFAVARAAIEAMRVPSAEMVEAGLCARSAHPQKDNTFNRYHRMTACIFDALITAALNAPPVPKLAPYRAKMGVRGRGGLR